MLVLFSFFNLCMWCAYTSVCPWMWAQAWVWAWERTVWKSEDTSASHFVWGEVSYSPPWASKTSISVSYFPVGAVEVQTCRLWSPLYMLSGGPNSHPHTCMAIANWATSPTLNAHWYFFCNPFGVVKGLDLHFHSKKLINTLVTARAIMCSYAQVRVNTAVWYQKFLGKV